MMTVPAELKPKRLELTGPPPEGDGPHRSLRIAIVSINYSPERTGISVYSTGMAEFLAAQGHDVHVYTGFPYYPEWSKRSEDRGRGFARETLRRVALHRCYLYVPSRPSTIKRIVHELSFTVSASLAYLFGPRADITIIVSPPLSIGVPVGVMARLKRSASVFHVQDLQPDAAVNLGMLRHGLITRLLFRLEKLTYSIVDRVSTISEAMRQKIEAKGVAAEKTIIFRNWANLDLVAPLPPAQSLRSEWGLDGKFVLLYAGNMGVKQGLDTLVALAKQLEEDPQIALVIVGDGGEKPALMRLSAALGASNVQFRPSVAREQISRMLATADISLIPQRPDVADLVLPSKLCNIVSSRRAVLAVAPSDSELAQIVSSNRCGLVVTPGNLPMMVNAVRSLKKNRDLRETMAENGYRFAHENLAEHSILFGFLGELHKLLASQAPRPDRGLVVKVVKEPEVTPGPRP
jgi:colanic acid biosynthesis glycosyl transferase WcaI